MPIVERPALDLTANGLPGLQERHFGTILADPPWQFQNRTGKVAPEHKRLHRYRTMTLDEIQAMRVSCLVGAANSEHLSLEELRSTCFRRGNENIPASPMRLTKSSKRVALVHSWNCSRESGVRAGCSGETNWRRRSRLSVVDYQAPASPLKWHGGKHYLAKRIVALMPPHLCYVEPYAGSLAVLLERDPNRDWLSHGEALPSFHKGCSEVVNDLHGELMNFWTVLQDAGLFGRFQRVVEAVPFSERMWKVAERLCQHADVVLRAVEFFVRCRQSRAGSFQGFAPLSRSRTRRGMNEQASAWLTCIEGLPEVHARLRRVVILNRDALDVIQQQDSENTLFYLDPPYLFETRSSTGEYEHEMTADDHRELLNVLSNCRGKFILSGYPSDLYNAAAKQHHWCHVDFELPNHASGNSEKRRMTERVWMNFEPAVE